ncbi:helix-turn-helix transcriptional regulator [Rhizorhabdus dicambivorans]|uniref:LuxR family transcriptional regulator n=1 Tax=Rhizorhabdus dicambivorans TaxID=1850238 RepID=A0A2A4FT91_9SPHN|nr:helix-turn-helix transcriptional regulator [Rhizorhabdus dicambivorans]PCE40658.1 LuxR family transcriptional regulator [Rhizorhabdus dicambivorans]
MDHEAIIDAIYEAGAMPHLWPDLLEKLAVLVGARGGNVIHARTGGMVRRASSPGIEATTIQFAAEGWDRRNSRLDRYLARPPYAGFLTDSDLHSEEELRTLPIYTDFLIPRGAAAGAATLIRGATQDTVAITLEAFADHARSRSALPILDALRPHLGRAATLSGRLAMEQARAAIEALEMIGTPAAMIDVRGRLLTANDLFDRIIGKSLLDSRSRLRLKDGRSDLSLGDAIERLTAQKRGSSIAISLDDQRRVAMHLLPVNGAARDIFSPANGLVVLADSVDDRLPEGDLLQALFDLTPTEARIARDIAQGMGAREAARAAGIAHETARTHLKVIFQKTNTRRQSELATLLPQYGLPTTQS